MDLGGILKHDAGEVASGEGTVDIALEALTAKVGEIAAMVDMGVAENDGIDPLWIEGEVAITFNRLPAPPLEETTFKQQSLAIEFNEIQ